MGQASAFLWAYVFHGGVAHALTDQAFEAASESPEAWTWVHFPLSDQRSRLYLEGLDELPAAARALILRTEQRVQIQFSGHWAFGVLPDLERDLDGRPVGSGRLLFAFDGHRLITARRQALRIVDELRREAEGGQVVE